jgi:5-methylcytosine-specific restriction endonuclease McrA
MECVVCGKTESPHWYGKQVKTCCRCYSKEYRIKNQQRVKETLAKYAKSCKGKARTKNWANTAKGKESSSKRNARFKSSEKYLEYIKTDRYQKLKKLYYKNGYFRKKNKDPWYHSLRRAKRRAINKQATPKWINQKLFIDFYKQSSDKFEVDHIIPLVNFLVCGLHVPWNLQILTKSENRSKGNKFDGTYHNESWRVKT